MKQEILNSAFVLGLILAVRQGNIQWSKASQSESTKSEQSSYK